MGGIGSGRYGERSHAEDFLKLDVRQLAKLGMLQLGARTLSWSRGGEAFSSLRVICLDEAFLRLRYQYCGEPVTQTIVLSSSPCHYGGVRPWFICPGKDCGARVAVLFGGGRLFACRHCQNLSYGSQRQSADFRRWVARSELEAKIWNRPKGMHAKTHKRLQRKAFYARYIGRVLSDSKLAALEKRLTKGKRRTKI